MKRCFKLFIPLLLLGIVVVAYFTRPSDETMLNTMKTRLTHVIGESMEERKSNAVAYSAWQIGGKQMVDLFTQKYVTVENYYLFSLVRIQWNDKSYVAGVGAFNKVYITKKINKELADKLIGDIENKLMDFLPQQLMDFFKILE